jgi:cysteinyl-tRNA synthetase
MLKIYNSLTRRKETFKPIEQGKVRIYVCGITAYDYCHIGHARMMVVFDMVTRYLRFLDLEVTYARNITDIDDKIIKRARENNESIRTLSERFIEAMNKDNDALGVLRPDLEPRATQYMDQIIDMIQRLLDQGFAYRALNGDIFYDVSAFPDYGLLSGKVTDELRAGARVDIQEAKDDPLDFVLWKAAKSGEPSWDSPWGPGRPGWHIECSAMSTHCLGDNFDIHGGGQDLQFPHHENEIAQSIGATGKPFVNLWMHNGFVRVDDTKMSKSLGNFFTVREVLKKYSPEVIRYFIVSSHYRSPLNYSDIQLNEAKSALDGLYLALREVPESSPGNILQDYEERFHQAMDDDFNTPKAIAVLHELAHDLNRSADKLSEEAQALAATMRRLGGILGLLQDTPENYLKSAVAPAEEGIPDADIDALVEERNQARQHRNFARADEIRGLLAAKGIVLEDSPQRTTWRRS